MSQPLREPSRYDYVAYDKHANELQAEFKSQMQALEKSLHKLTKSRYQALALTASEEFYCWVGKAIRDDQIKRNGDAPLEEGRSNS